MNLYLATSIGSGFVDYDNENKNNISVLKNDKLEKKDSLISLYDENVIKNNHVKITGIISEELKPSHKTYDEEFFSLKVKVPRLSNFFDEIPLTISKVNNLSFDLKIGTEVAILGQFRSYNNFTKVGNRLILTVFVKNIELLDEGHESKNQNSVYLNGYICKTPIYRVTPFGREISDLLIAVNRMYNKSDYIPCIAWGKNAKFVQNFKLGTNIKVWGRIQSREYQKKLDDMEFIKKTAYEVSISKITIVENAS